MLQSIHSSYRGDATRGDAVLHVVFDKSGHPIGGDGFIDGELTMWGLSLAMLAVGAGVHLWVAKVFDPRRAPSQSRS
jgi:hypothetical protein